MDEPVNARAKIEALAAAVAQDFESTRRVLSFDEWFELLCGAPHLHARNAAQYLRDCFDHYGRRDVRIPSGKVARFRLFDCEFDGGVGRLVGQELAQNAFYEALDGFVRIGFARTGFVEPEFVRIGVVEPEFVRAELVVVVVVVVDGGGRRPAVVVEAPTALRAAWCSHDRGLLEWSVEAPARDTRSSANSTIAGVRVSAVPRA